MSESITNPPAPAMPSKADEKSVFYVAIAITVGFFGLLAVESFVAIPQANMTPINIMLGVLGTSFTSVVNFYFGSNKDSAAKTAMIYQAAGPKGP